MFIAALGVIAALAFVLGLGLFALWALKRFGSGTLSPRSRVAIEVVQRVSLGPKTGLAVVRVGERVMAVSIGEGGIRPLFELDEEDRQRVIATSPLPLSLVPSAEAAASLSAMMPAAMTGTFGRMFARANALQGAESGTANSTANSTAGSTTNRATNSTTHRTTNTTTNRAPNITADGEFHSILNMSLRTTTRLAVLAGAMVLCGAVSSHASAQGTPPVTTGAGTAPVPPGVVTLPVVMPRSAAQPTRTARPANAIAGPRPLPLPPLRGQAVANDSTAPRRGNGASIAPGGTAVSRPTVDMRFDSLAAQAASMLTRNPRAAAASPAPIAADDAIMGMLPQMDVKVGDEKDGGLRLNGTVGIVVMMGLMTLLPTLMLMMTGFTRILIVLHFLKQAMGTQGAPPAHLLAALALLLTGFVMAPTLTQVNTEAVTPWLDGKITQVEMLKTGVKPMREFMLRQTRESDVKTFIELSRLPRPETVDDVPLHVLMSAFVASELRTSFQIGFAIYLPFIIIDTVVASVLMSMGMFMLPPAMISLPFKLLLFVLVDGWSLTIQSLVQSFK